MFVKEWTYSDGRPRTATLVRGWLWWKRQAHIEWRRTIPDTEKSNYQPCGWYYVDTNLALSSAENTAIDEAVWALHKQQADQDYKRQVAEQWRKVGHTIPAARALPPPLVDWA